MGKKEIASRHLRYFAKWGRLLRLAWPGAWLTLFCDFLSGHLHGDDVLPAEAPPMNQDRPGLGSGSHHTSGLCPRLARAQLRRMALAVQSGGNVEETRSVRLALISL